MVIKGTERNKGDVDNTFKNVTLINMYSLF